MIFFKKKTKKLIDKQQVSSSSVHKAGINLRHLGRIRRAAKVEGVRVLILTAVRRLEKKENFGWKLNFLFFCFK